MKNVRQIVVLIILTIAVGCTNQQQNTTELLSDEAKRTEIMTTISNDHDMMTEIMDHMGKSDHAMQMMAGNRELMAKMMDNTEIMKDTVRVGIMMDNMMKMMEKDSSMCTMMGRKMRGNKHMMNMRQNTSMTDGMMVCPMHGKNRSN